MYLKLLNGDLRKRMNCFVNYLNVEKYNVLTYFVLYKFCVSVNINCLLYSLQFRLDIQLHISFQYCCIPYVNTMNILKEWTQNIC